MSKAAKVDALEMLHKKVAEVLTSALTPDASPQMIAQAIKFLKDNGIEPAKDVDNSALNELEEKVNSLRQSNDPDAIKAFLQ